MGSAVVDDDFDGGWDNRATLVDGRWVDRSPRHPDREAQLRREAVVLPWLAPLLPLPIPVPRVVSEDPLTVRHAYLPGGPCPGTEATHGAAVGWFLRALHAVDPDDALAHGVVGPDEVCAETTLTVERMAAEVLPLLPHDLRGAGEALLDRALRPPPSPCVAHGDLGPDHVRVVGGQVTGVIDWGDCGMRDPAIDLAWTVHGAAPAFADAVMASYRPDPAVVVRGLDLHLLGPWHEVLHGLGSGGPAYVESGLAGVVTRLRRGRARRGG